MNDQTHPELQEIPIGIDATGMPRETEIEVRDGAEAGEVMAMVVSRPAAGNSSNEA